MVGNGHTKETVGLLNVNSIHLYTLFDGRSWSYQRNCGVVKYKLYTFIPLFGSRSWLYQRNRGVVKYKLYTFIHPLW